MRELAYEEPVVPVYIDRDKELQAYYSCVDELAKEPPHEQQNYPNATAPGYYPPPNQHQQVPRWQGFGYPPQPTGYPQMPPQSAYPTYPANQGYTSYPYPTTYGPPPTNPYGAQNAYPGYGYPSAPMPQAQSGWTSYNPPYGGYVQAQQPMPYQQGYPPYPGYDQPAQNDRDPEFVRRKHQSTEHAVGPGGEGEPSISRHQPQASAFGWNEALFSDLQDYERDYNRSHLDAGVSGQPLVQETVTSSHASSDYVYDYYAKQFDQLRIGWNV